MSFDNLQVDLDGAVVIVTISRPRVLNALNTQTLDELRRVVLDLKQDDGVRAIIVTGAGDKAFVAGADINELAVLSPAEGTASIGELRLRAFDLAPEARSDRPIDPVDYTVSIEGGTLTTDALPDFKDWQLGAGLGLRYYSSFGPIRVDVGTPLNPRANDAKIAVVVSLGQAF